MLKKLGPGILVTAAFIGPGTITTATACGAHFGFALLWALFFSVVATIILQEMAARLGLVTGKGLSEALRHTFHGPLRLLVIVLVILALGVGNSAYQAGNIIGAAIGMEMLVGMSRPVWCIVIGVVAFLLLGVGIYKVMEKFLIVLVLLMSAVFLTTMLLVKPDVLGMLSGMFTPQVPSGAVLTIVALIGTTVVPYNLFLHSGSVREKWDASIPLPQALRESRLDTTVSVALGGFITMAVTVTAAAAFFGSDRTFSATNMAQQLEPVLGPGATYFFSFGMLAAGISSAVTAPLAAAYATCGVLGWSRELNDPRFRMIWATVLAIGTIAAAAGGSPIQAILFAQAANGILLPISAIFLLIIMNRTALLSNYRNRLWTNVLGGIVVLVVSALGCLKLLEVFGLF
jgi:manganese transport protein